MNVPLPYLHKESYLYSSYQSISSANAAFLFFFAEITFLVPVQPHTGSTGWPAHTMLEPLLKTTMTLLCIASLRTVRIQSAHIKDSLYHRTPLGEDSTLRTRQ